jgi:Subtilase family
LSGKESMKVFMTVTLASLLLAEMASRSTAQTAVASPPAITASTEGNAVVTAPVIAIWAKAYPDAAAHLQATNADGLNNQQKMLELLPPDNQATVLTTPIPIASTPLSTVPYAQRQAQLHEQAAEDRATLNQRNEELKSRAAQAGVPITVLLGGGKVGTLVNVDSSGRPAYVTPDGIYSASTSRSDQLWPTNSVTAVPGWISGRSGLNLTGTNQLIDMWEADYTPGDAGVQTNHDQFVYDTNGDSRVSQGDAGYTGFSPHATAVAGVIASAGYSQYFNLTNFFGPAATNVDLGNYSRGLDYQGDVTAWSLLGYQGNFDDEAGNGLAAANNSFDEVAGWEYIGTNWTWFGGNNTNLSDWQFGAYVGSYTGPEGGFAPRQLDSLSYQAPNTLILFSSGDNLNVGPGQATNYVLYGSLTPQSATKNWLDGDAGGYRTIPPSQSAKDVLTVGAIYALTPGYSNASDVVLAPFSSVGPTTDGRIKPEVVAAGIVADTTNAYNPYGFPGIVCPTYDTNYPAITYDYGWWNGTSFSAPAVASGLGLVLEERLNIQPTWETNGYPLLSSTLRALAVATADQVGTNAGPSYKYGYGVFDSENAVNLMAADAITATNPASGLKPYIKEVDLPAGSVIQYNIYATNSGTPLKVTLAWTDPQGPAQTSGVENDPTPRLVNDLDLRVYPPGTTSFDPNASSTYKPWILNPDLTNLTVAARSAPATTGDDTRNNLEQVVVNSPVTGTNYIVRVTYKGTLKDNNGATTGGQWASLIMSGNLATALPFEVTGFYQQPNGQFIITWNAVVGGEYIVQGSDDLSNWTDLTGPINANLESMSELVSPSGSYYFYRIARYY